MTHDYGREQIGQLLDLMPELMAVLRQLRDAPGASEVFDRLDRFCWHRPHCEPGDGDVCYGGLPTVHARRLP